jgi:hypothetical protein
MNSILIGSNQTPKRPITSITPVRPIKIEYLDKEADWQAVSRRGVYEYVVAQRGTLRVGSRWASENAALCFARVDAPEPFGSPFVYRYFH